MHLQWNDQGSVLVTFVGHGLGGFAPIVTDRWSQLAQQASRITILADCGRMEALDFRLQTEGVDWVMRHRAQVAEIHLHVVSRVVVLAAQFVNVVTKGMFRIYTDRAAFDVMLRDHGLGAPPNVAPPAGR
jgi:hypothetical protein